MIKRDLTKRLESLLSEFQKPVFMFNDQQLHCDQLTNSGDWMFNSIFADDFEFDIEVIFLFEYFNKLPNRR